MKKYSEAEIKQIVQEATDPNKVTLVCDQHYYIGYGPPVIDCPKCWTVYYMLLIAKTPPHLREERFQQLESVVQHMAEDEEKGNGIKLFQHPEVKIEKDSD